MTEVSQVSVGGRMAEVYQEIRHALDVPMVNLIYRYLASQPSYFDQAWQQLAPNLRSQQAHAAGARLRQQALLPGAPAIPATALPAVGVSGQDRQTLRQTLRIYNQANPMNLQAVQAMLSALDDEPLATGAADAKAAPITATDGVQAALLPMSQLEQADAVTTALLIDMGRPLTGVKSGEPDTGIVPSLLRHFIPWPPLLALMWTALRPVLLSPAFTMRAQQLAATARQEVADWPHPVMFSAHDAQQAGVSPTAINDIRALLQRFTQIIPSMIVFGVTLASILPTEQKGADD